MERFVAPMATWEIVGGDLPPVRVRARTFDEALAKAQADAAAVVEKIK